MLNLFVAVIMDNFDYLTQTHLYLDRIIWTSTSECGRNMTQEPQVTSSILTCTRCSETWSLLLALERSVLIALPTG
ncbi:hypothetical protein NP493_4856g00000 [Ridgeia piscesae]|uniref:Uncharacterized protein n=1 Tax=Ridgeia piscesae TaxID=27915 RepID=A0AAD9MTL0_RIDPI|nr:hypothetical protein NP493_4856g00000 [Ridgeia piscesae]